MAQDDVLSGGEEGQVRTMTSEELEYCRLLLDRFNYLTDLRTMTAHRHITLIGLAGAFMAGIFQFGKAEGQNPIAGMLIPASIVLLMLGACVTTYDAMIRTRARAVACEMKRVVGASGSGLSREEKPGFPFRFLHEDFWFFSQILTVNSLAVIPLSLEVTQEGRLESGLGARGCIAYGLAFLAFWLLWVISHRMYILRGGANNWLPRA